MITESSRTILLRTCGIIFFTGIIIFMFFKFQALIFGPHIAQISLDDYSKIEEDTLDIVGKVKYTETLFIQGRSVTLNESGDFKETLVLPQGESIIEIQLIDPFKKTKFYYFHIYADYHEKEASLEVELPTINEESL